MEVLVSFFRQRVACHYCLSCLSIYELLSCHYQLFQLFKKRKSQTMYSKYLGCRLLLRLLLRLFVRLLLKAVLRLLFRAIGLWL